MFLCVSDVDENKKYINLHSIKEFFLNDLEENGCTLFSIIFHTFEFKTYHINFEQDSHRQACIHFLTTYGQEHNVYCKTQ